MAHYNGIEGEGLVAELVAWADHYAGHALQSNSHYEQGKADGYRFAADLCKPFDARLVAERDRADQAETRITELETALNLVLAAAFNQGGQQLRPLFGAGED